MAFLIKGDMLRRYEPEAEETTVAIPDGIRWISRYCFKKQKQLTDIVIPEGVEGIGQDAFAGCTGLREIRFPASLKEIEMYAFRGCTNLEKVYFSSPPEQAHIPSVFWDTPWLAAQGDFIIIGDTLYECRKKDAVIRIPDGVRHIRPYLFYRNQKITQVHLPDGLLTIGNSAFYHCLNLCSINIPDTVQYIGWCAFYNCSGVQVLSVPLGVKEISWDAFSNTSWMENKTEEFTILGDGILYQCRSQAKKVVMPQEVKRITLHAFRECSSMTGLVTQTAQGNLTVYEAGGEFPVEEWERMMEIVHENDPQKQEELFVQLKKASCKIPLALYMTRLSDRPFFHAYLRRMCKRTMELFITHEDTEAISQMMQLGLVTSKNVDGFITYANTAGALESQMLLMHYKHEQLGYKKPENAFRL